MYYDCNLIFKKLKFRSNIKPLLTGSKRYDPINHMTIENSTKKRKQTAPEETNNTIVIAFGAAMFGNLRGNVPTPTKCESC